MRFELKPKWAQLSDAELLSDIRRVAALVEKRYVTSSDYERYGQYDCGTLRQRFGHWKDVNVHAGLAPEVRPTATAELLIDDLQQVAKQLGSNVLTLPEYSKHGKWSANPIVRVFGSWIHALKAAGLSPGTDRISDDELFENMEHVWTKLGRQPSYSEFRHPISRFSRGTYAARFGGWRNALEAFVLWVSNEDIDQSTASPAEWKPVKQPDRDSVEIPIVRTPKRTPREINLRLRFRVLQHNRFTCVACGRSPATLPGLALHVDHIIPWSRGGETTFDNLQTLCESCNLGKSNMIFGDKGLTDV